MFHPNWMKNTEFLKYQRNLKTKKRKKKEPKPTFCMVSLESELRKIFGVLVVSSKIPPYPENEFTEPVQNY